MLSQILGDQDHSVHFADRLQGRSAKGDPGADLDCLTSEQGTFVANSLHAGHAHHQGGSRMQASTACGQEGEGCEQLLLACILGRLHAAHARLAACLTFSSNQNAAFTAR